MANWIRRAVNADCISASAVLNIQRQQTELAELRNESEPSMTVPELDQYGYDSKWQCDS